MIPVAHNPNGTEVFLCVWPKSSARYTRPEDEFVFAKNPTRYEWVTYGQPQKTIMPLSQIPYGHQIFEAEIRFDRAYYSMFKFEVKGLSSTLRLELDRKAFLNLFKRTSKGEIQADQDGWLKVCLTGKKTKYRGCWIIVDHP